MRERSDKLNKLLAQRLAERQLGLVRSAKSSSEAQLEKERSEQATTRAERVVSVLGVGLS